MILSEPAYCICFGHGHWTISKLQNWHPYSLHGSHYTFEETVDVLYFLRNVLLIVGVENSCLLRYIMYELGLGTAKIVAVREVLAERSSRESGTESNGCDRRVVSDLYQGCGPGPGPGPGPDQFASGPGPTFNK